MSSLEADPSPSLQRRLLWRLTLGIGLLLGTLFVALDVLLDLTMYQRLDQFLEARANAFSVQLERRGHEDMDTLLAAYDLAGHTEFFAIYDGSGRLRTKSGNSTGGTVSLPQRLGASIHYDTTLPDGHRGRAFARPLSTDGWLVLATERESWDRTERRMHGIMAGGIVLAILLAVAMCLLLVRHAFRTMTEEGSRLAAMSPDQAAQLHVDHLPREMQSYARAVRDALERSHQALERERRFSRHVAHELRTPVAEVRLAVEHALREGDAPALRKGMEAALCANARMERSIHALLALSRWESGLESPEPDPLDLSMLLRQLIDATAGSHPDVPPVQLQAPPSAWVHSDTGMLERILANLLHNALDYGDPARPVRVRLQQEADGYRLRVCNAASGLHAEDVAHFGERYWRGRDRGGDRRHAGLGLALSQALANALGLRLVFSLEHDEVIATLGPFAAL